MASEEKWLLPSPGRGPGEFVEDVRPSTGPGILEILNEYEDIVRASGWWPPSRWWPPKAERWIEAAIRSLRHLVPRDEDEFVEDEVPVAGLPDLAEYRLG